MHSGKQSQNAVFGMIQGGAWQTLMMLMVLLIPLISLTILTAEPAQGQTYQVIYNFTGGTGGAYPISGLTLDSHGNLYGTSEEGPVFVLRHTSAGWVYVPLPSGQGGADGWYNAAEVVFGPDGKLYGNYAMGGECGCDSGWRSCGTVFRLDAPTRALAEWDLLYQFRGGTDGANSWFGPLTFGKNGKIYGTTQYGGSGCGGQGSGTVFELTHSAEGWGEKRLYAFKDGADGSNPAAGVVFDAAGNLYGMTLFGGACGSGTVFQLTRSGSDWIETVIHDFCGNDGAYPYGGLTLDAAGNLYGAERDTAFELTPTDAGWTFSVLHRFTADEGSTSYGGLVMDQAGNLYGTLALDGPFGKGAIYKLTHSAGGWNYTSLHDFTGGDDGGWPTCRLRLDSRGHLFGTASGGAYTQGVVFEITQ